MMSKANITLLIKEALHQQQTLDDDVCSRLSVSLLEQYCNVSIRASLCCGKEGQAIIHNLFLNKFSPWEEKYKSVVAAAVAKIDEKRRCMKFRKPKLFTNRWHPTSYGTLWLTVNQGSPMIKCFYSLHFCKKRLLAIGIFISFLGGFGCCTQYYPGKVVLVSLCAVFRYRYEVTVGAILIQKTASRWFKRNVVSILLPLPSFSLHFSKRKPGSHVLWKKVDHSS